MARGAGRDVEEVDLKDAVRAGKPKAPAVPTRVELVTGDPGTLKAALAWFRHGRLVGAVLLRPPSAWPIGMRVANLRRLAAPWIRDMAKRSPRYQQSLKTIFHNTVSQAQRQEHYLKAVKAYGIVEQPEVYRRGPHSLGSKHDRDTVWVGSAAGALMTALEPVIEDLTTQNPKEWKDQREKKAHNQICRDALEDDEKALLGEIIWDDNVMDAIGIGLKELMRVQ